MLTAQQIFDKGLAHIRSQGKASVVLSTFSSRWACRYLGPDGAKCIVGALIDDAYYDPDMEGRSVGDLNFPGQLALHRSGVNWEAGLGLLTDMQRAHDNAANPRGALPFMEEFEQRMQKAARRHGLTYTPPGAPA